MTIPFLTVKPKSIKLKVSPRFPAQVIGSGPITVTKDNGNWTIGANFTGYIFGPLSGTSLTLSGALNVGGAIAQVASGYFFSDSGAIIDRFFDRVFIADAAYHSGANVSFGGDWFSTFQQGIGRSYGWITQTETAILNSVAAGNNAAQSLLVAAQTNHFSALGNCIGTINVGISNNSTFATQAYASYNEAYRMLGTLGGATGHEIDTVNYASVVPIDPFQQSSTQTIGLQLAAGAELSGTGQFSASAAINIRNNNSNFNAGIVFGNDSIAGTAGNDGGTGAAIEMATGHAIYYYYSTGNVSWQLVAGVGANGNYNFLTNGTGAVVVPSLLAKSASGGVGYATGASAGGVVTQLTSRTTAVVLNKITGAITMFAAAPAVGTPVSFTLTNSAIAATDVVNVSVKSATNTYRADVTATAAGSCQITVTSLVGTTSDSPVINFVVIKGSAN